MIPRSNEAVMCVLVGLTFVLAACSDSAPEPAPSAKPTQAPARASSTAVAPSASASAAKQSAPACPPFPEDGLTFFDNNPVPSQRDYPESYLYKLEHVAGACPATHVDITVTGPGLVGGIKARLAPRSPTKIDLLAEPTADAAEGTWRPEMKRDQLLGSIVLKNGKAVGLRLPKLSGPNTGLPVFHPDTDLALDQ